MRRLLPDDVQLHSSFRIAKMLQYVAVLFWSSNVTADQKTKQAYPIEAFVHVLQTSTPSFFSQKVLLCIEKDREISLVKPVEEQTR